MGFGFCLGEAAAAFLVGWFCCFALGLKAGAGNRREPSYRQLFRKVLSRLRGGRAQDCWGWRVSKPGVGVGVSLYDDLAGSSAAGSQGTQPPR